ncbi:MAG: hypothetical protein J0H65_02920 [Rhizobiales bacterium]|nr:hypothetical protein [Hyphomicrobiales bacterium]
MLRAEDRQVNPLSIRENAWLTRVFCSLSCRVRRCDLARVISRTRERSRVGTAPSFKSNQAFKSRSRPSRGCSTLLFAAVVLALTLLLARAIICRIARLGLAMALLVLLARALLLIAALFLLGMLLATLGLAALLAGVPVLICHLNVSWGLGV